MTRDEFLARCALAYDADLCTPESLRLMERWLDAVMRFEGGQTGHVIEFLSDESRRLGGFRQGSTLAGDDLGYGLIKLAAILTHHCQRCATDMHAWWTRGAFCNHAAHGCGVEVTT